LASTTVTGLTPNTKYLLSFEVSGDNRPFGLCGSCGSWGLNVTANNSPLNLIGVDLLPGTNPGTIETLLFTSNGSGDANLSFLETTADGSQASPIIDNVAISTTPLPSAWTMLIAGFAGLGFFVYRGSKRQAAALSAA
jgi:hypothetical protein